MLPQLSMLPLWCMLLPLSTVELDKCLTSLCLSPTRESTGPPPSQRLSDLPSLLSLTTPMLPMDVGSQGLWPMLLLLSPLVRHYSRQIVKSDRKKSRPVKFETKDQNITKVDGK